jgi:predicted nucleic acid-binding protein
LAIEIIVNDSSCLIDLRKGGLLTTALQLRFRFIVAYPLVAAELHGFDDADWEDLRRRGLEVIDLDDKQVGRAIDLKGQLPSLSAYDCFSLALAEGTPNSMLLTGDQQLRKKAEALGVVVHGVLWIADEIDKTNLMSLDDLADALERLDADPLVFLPKTEVVKRIESLRKRIRGGK